tara:strand:+ start:501 stop:701 length:201 start_codon:yes stop_codon:yes gene_type:complete
MKDINRIEFEKFNGSWTAMVFLNNSRGLPPVCVSWQKIGSLKKVKSIIKNQLSPAKIATKIIQEET